MAQLSCCVPRGVAGGARLTSTSANSAASTTRSSPPVTTNRRPSASHAKAGATDQRNGLYECTCAVRSPQAPRLVEPDASWAGRRAATFHHDSRTGNQQAARRLNDAYRRSAPYHHELRRCRSQGSTRPGDQRNQPLLVKRAVVADGGPNNSCSKSGPPPAPVQLALVVKSRLLHSERW